MAKLEYCGGELDIFEKATNWKNYWSELIRSHIGKSVLDVGAGIGATSVALNDAGFDRWVSVEPDASLCEKIINKIEAGKISNKTEIMSCVIADLPVKEKFDTILYVDVLEHIENDGDELMIAATFLDTGGKIVIISPAHNFLFSPFDKKIGHYRRYNKKMISGIVPPSLKLVVLKYIDSIGFFASLANKFILKTSDPAPTQVMIWDSYLVPLSRIIDPLIFYKAGKSILVVMEKR